MPPIKILLAAETAPVERALPKTEPVIIDMQRDVVRASACAATPEPAAVPAQ